MFQLGKYGIKTLKTKKVLTVTYIIAVTLILAVCMVGLNVTKQIDDNFFKKDGQYDIIVGKTGSETGLVMGSLFFNYDNQGTIAYSEVDKIKETYPKFLKVEPIAMGDVYGKSQVIGVRSSYLEGKQYSSGLIFNDKNMEVVVGYTLAEKRGLKVGDKIQTSHGSTYGETHNEGYLISGILEKENTSSDNAIFTSINNIWETHGIDSNTGMVVEEHDHTESSTEQVSGVTDSEGLSVKTREEVYGDVLKEDQKWVYADEELTKRVDFIEEIQTKLLNIASEVPTEITDEAEIKTWEENRKLDLETKLKNNAEELDELIKEKTITKKVDELVLVDARVVEVQSKMDSIKEELKSIEAPFEVDDIDELGNDYIKQLTPAEQTQWKAKKEAELNAELGRLTTKLSEVKEQAKLSIRIDLELKETETFLETLTTTSTTKPTETKEVENGTLEEVKHSYGVRETEDDLDGREVTAILIRTGNMAEGNNLIANYKDSDKIQAVQTTHVMRGLLENIDLGAKVAKLLIIIIGIQSLVILSILTGLFINGFIEDIKTFKIIGYSKRIIMWYMLVQMFTILAVSTVLGVILSRLGLFIMNKTSSEIGLVIDYMEIYVDELYSIIGVNLFVLVPLVLISYVLLKRK